MTSFSSIGYKGGKGFSWRYRVKFRLAIRKPNLFWNYVCLHCSQNESILFTLWFVNMTKKSCPVSYQRQWVQMETREVPSEHTGVFYYESDWSLAQVAQRGCGDIQKSYGHGHSPYLSRVSWTRWPWKVPSSLYHLVIMWTKAWVKRFQ